MAPEAAQDGAPRAKPTILSLPREVRDDIWMTLLHHDMLILSSQHKPPQMHAMPESCPHALAMFALLEVSRAVNAEITAAVARHTFTFPSSNAARRLLKNGLGYWCCAWQRLQRPGIFLHVQHLRIVPQRSIYTHRSDGQPAMWLANAARRRTLYCSSAHPHGWGNVDAGLAPLLKYICGSSMRLRSLEMAAVLLLNVSLVRRLRRLRGVELHFAFVPEDDGQGSGLEWLAETGHTDIVLPVYETQEDTRPVSAVPLSCLAAAIRKEVAGTEDAPSRPHAVPTAEVDLPFYIDVAEGGNVAVGGLPAPSSGWYRYSGRDPGIACLEKSQEPSPQATLPRKMRKRQQQQLGRRCATEGSFHMSRGPKRTRDVDKQRALVLSRMHLPGVVVKHERVPESLQQI